MIEKKYNKLIQASGINIYTQNINRNPSQKTKPQAFKKSPTLESNQKYRRMKTNPLLKHVNRSPTPTRTPINDSQVSPLIMYPVKPPKSLKLLKAHNNSPKAARKRIEFKAEVPDHPEPKKQIQNSENTQDELYYVNEDYGQLPDSLVRLIKLKLIKEDTVKAYRRRIDKFRNLLGSNNIVTRTQALQQRKNDLENHLEIAKHTLNDEIMLREDQKISHAQIGINIFGLIEWMTKNNILKTGKKKK